MGRNYDEQARKQAHAHRLLNKEIKHKERMAMYRIMEADPEMKLWLIVFGSAALGTLGKFLKETFPEWDVSEAEVSEEVLQVSPWVWLSPALAAQIATYGSIAGYDVQFGDTNQSVGALIQMGTTSAAAMAAAAILLKAMSGGDSIITKFLPTG